MANMMSGYITYCYHIESMKYNLHTSSQIKKIKKYFINLWASLCNIMYFTECDALIIRSPDTYKYSS